MWFLAQLDPLELLDLPAQPAPLEPPVPLGPLDLPAQQALLDLQAPLELWTPPH
jgi:hypothetical protein